MADTNTVDTVVIGGGQAGLAVGYHLSRMARPHVILDANARIGDPWRRRWDSLRLFTPARYDGLPGMPFPAPPNTFPTKDEMADFLEAYAAAFDLPVRLGTRVERVARTGGGEYTVRTRHGEWHASNVVVAMGSYQRPLAPPFAGALDPGIVQVHAADYRNPRRLRTGPVLIVGAGNSGAEIAMEVARTHTTLVAGRDTGHIPFRIDRPIANLLLTPLVLRVVFHRLITVATPLGRRVRPKLVGRGGPLIRVKPADLASAGVERVPRLAGVRDGLPLLEDGRVLTVANVIWCTGYDPGLSWLDLPVLNGREPMHDRGIVESEPGLYFVGLHFQYALSSGMIQGVGRDAERIVKAIARRPIATRGVSRTAAAVPRR